MAWCCAPQLRYSWNAGNCSPEMVLNNFHMLTKAAFKPWKDQVLVYIDLRKRDGNVTHHFSSPIKLKIIQHSKQTCFSSVFSDDIFIAGICEYWSIVFFLSSLSSLLRQVQVSTAWTPCAASQMGKQHAHLLEECWNDWWEDVARPGSTGVAFLSIAFAADDSPINWNLMSLQQ